MNFTEAELIGAMPSLHVFALKLTQNHHRAEDLVQDTMVNALRSQHTFLVGSNIAAWLRIVCRNAFINGLRKAQRDLMTFDGEELVVPAPPNQLDHLALQDLQRGLDSLRPEERDAILAMTFDGTTFDVLAQRQRVPAGTIKSRVFRGRQKLEAWV